VVEEQSGEVGVVQDAGDEVARGSDRDFENARVPLRKSA
jgi:hypothetical protein